MCDLYDITSKFDRIVTLDAIEEKKNMECVLDVVDQLSEYNTKKNDILHVYGGGITQDVAGMAASMYKRGLKWSYTPTTLLSMCDSCIGGKTSINYSGFKNKLGNFYGGGIWSKEPYSNYYNSPNLKGTLYKSRRRFTEIEAKTKIHSPSPTFNCVGPGAVGTGTLAGMRVLNFLKNKINKDN